MIPICIIAGCDSSSTTARTSSNVTTPQENVNSVSPAIASGFNLNTHTDFVLTKVNLTSASNKVATVSQLAKNYPNNTFDASKQAKSDAKSLSFGDLLTVNGGLIDQNNTIYADIVNNDTKITIKNTFTSYQDIWYDNGNQQTVNGNTNCGDGVPIHTEMVFLGREFDDKIIYWNNYPSYTSGNMLKTPPVINYASSYKPNTGKAFNAVAYFFDSKYSVSVKYYNGNCKTESVTSTDFNLYKLPYNITSYIEGAESANSGTDLEPGDVEKRADRTYSHIINIFVRDKEGSETKCADLDSYYKRVISHEVGHFMSSAMHSNDENNLMYPFTRCGANTILPAMLSNSTSSTMISEFREVQSPSGLLRWIP